MSCKCQFLNNLDSNRVVTTTTDSKGITEPPVSVASTRLKVLRFDIGPWTALFLANATDLWRLRGPFREGYSKHSSESADDITIELQSVSRGNLKKFPNAGLYIVKPLILQRRNSETNCFIQASDQMARRWTKFKGRGERYPLTEGDWVKKLSFAKPAGEVEIAASAICEWSEAGRLIH